MAYTLPTVSTLKTMYPAFADVPDATVQLYIDQAARTVDTSWTETNYADGIMLLACHNMVMAGLGKGAEAQANAEGLAGYSMVKSGQLTLQKSATSRSDAEGVPSPWNSTGYGIQFYWLARHDRPGGVVALADISYPSGYAKDWPYGYRYGFPGIF